jgi:hypothetical protein
LEPAYEAYNRYAKIKRDIESAKELLENKEFEDLAKEETQKVRERKGGVRKGDKTAVGAKRMKGTLKMLYWRSGRGLVAKRLPSLLPTC